MAIDVTVPRLGWSMDEGVFVEWLKKNGDWITKGDMLYVLEGDKAALEIECLDEGTLYIPDDSPEPGDTVRVGQLLAWLLAKGESAPEPEDSPSVTPSVPEPAGDVKRAVPASHPAPATEASRVRSTPRARRKAEELGVDWKEIAGSGRRGRVRERDVIASSSSSKPAIGAPSGIRQTIANRMQTSHQETAPVTLTTTVDATNLVQLRSQFKAVAKESTVVPSFTDFLVKLTSTALLQHPHLNARWTESRVTLMTEINIGIAVDTEEGLLVPVLPDAPARTLREIAVASADLARRARQRKLAPTELRGGTFTISNLGTFGIDAFTPIINLPECAILGVGRIVSRPAIVNGQIVPRDQMALSLTFDHRIVDGAPAARFLQTLSELIENPAPALVD